MKYRQMGTSGPEVSSIGLGCTGMSIGYGVPDEEESLRTLDVALERGVTLEDIVPIRGTKRRRYLTENVSAAGLVLSEEQLDLLRRAVPEDAVSGGRYPDQALARVGH